MELLAQIDQDKNFTIHGQTTVITQFKMPFSAKYSGSNSLSTQREQQTSLTATLYAGARLWKGASVYFNPEIAGGSGLSSALGIADATNGETFRIGNPEPRAYVARMYFQQVFNLGDARELQEDGVNQLQGSVSKRFIRLTLGKVSLSDFFDANIYSHDARTQFMSWGLMANGAWDYPANTRGYTPSAVVELVNGYHELRGAVSLMPKTANGNSMNYHVGSSNSLTLEYTHHHWLVGRNGKIRVLGFYTTTGMGKYAESIRQSPEAPDITTTRMAGRTKYGFAINAEQSVNEDIGVFARASWNDGKNETWAFTEIDNSFSFGMVSKGTKWGRPDDTFGIAAVFSGISKDHQNYLKRGGKGFMLGDGNLNYSRERLFESYYSWAFSEQFSLSGTYQLVDDPGYNKDRRGPVNIFSVRIHASI